MLVTPGSLHAAFNASSAKQFQVAQLVFQPLIAYLLVKLPIGKSS